MQLNTALAQRQHYALVRARLNAAAKKVAEKRVVVIEAKPRAPEPKYAWIYPAAIGPIQQGLVIETDDAFRTHRYVMGVIEQCCRKHGVTLIDVKSERRDKVVVWCRHEIFYRLRHETTWSLPKIGKFFNRDHTTCLAGLRQHTRRLANGTAK